MGKTIGEKLLAVIDKAVTPQTKPEPAPVLDAVPKIDEALIHHVVEMVGFKPPKDKVAFLAEQQRRHKVGDDLLVLRDDWHATQDWQNQGNSLAHAIANGEKFPEEKDWFNREDFIADYSEQRDAIKKGFRLIGAVVVPVVKELFEAFEKACEEKLAEVTNTERRRAQAHGIVFSGNTDTVVLKAVIDYAKTMARTQNPDSGASPQSRLAGLIKF